MPLWAFGRRVGSPLGMVISGKMRGLVTLRKLSGRSPGLYLYWRGSERQRLSREAEKWRETDLHSFADRL